MFADVVRVACLGAHPDDIEIGCGGTIQAILRANPDVDIRWTVATSDETRRIEAQRSAELYLGGADRLSIHAFGDNRLPYADPVGVKAAFAGVWDDATPDLVFCPRRDDAHQDHRFVGELAWQLYRGATILEYEIVKWDGDLTPPNVFVPLTADDVAGKVRRLHEAFPSQVAKPWFEEEVFRSLLRIRGVECGAASGYAEAFHGAKLTLR